MTAPWYFIHNTNELLSPSLVVYPDRIAANISAMLQIAGHPDRLRPHIKTHKMAEIVQMQIQQGIRQFKCATIAEAELLADSGAADVLLAYQPVGPNQKRLLALQQAFPTTRFSALVDDLEVAKALSEHFAGEGGQLGVFLDMDVGHHRTGIAASPDAAALCQYCCAAQGLQFRGLHIYDGHVVEEAMDDRKASSDGAFSSLNGFIDQVTRLAGTPPELVVGGSPTFGLHAQRERITCSPGTSLLWDWGYSSKYPDLPFQHAALVVSRIISKPTHDRLCLDLGHKAVAADQPMPRVHFLNLPNARHLMQNEEHLVLQVADNSSFAIGELLYGLPKHICPTCALYDSAAVVRAHRIETFWKVAARDRRLRF